jgi:signal transduction histidine kinase
MRALHQRSNRDAFGQDISPRAGHRLAERRRVRGGRDPNSAERRCPVAGCTAARLLADVDAVQNRLLLAGGLALLLALLVGYAAARLFRGRIRRLERAADRIAGGRFDEPVADRSADELGELARAFDRMRIRLAGLDHARREFVANASHELRTPLFSLGGFLELLEDEELDEPTRREFLDTMTVRSVG